MAVKIRLARMGSKKRPYYRIVAADARSPRDGRFLERLGTYDPHAENVVINDPRVAYWESQGAAATETVQRLLRRARNVAAGKPPRAVKPKTKKSDKKKG